MEVKVFFAGSDNYFYLLWDEPGRALAVDPPESEQILDFLEDNELSLAEILVTHHHCDHTSGVEELKKKTGCVVIGPDPDRSPAIDRLVKDNETLLLGPWQVRVIAVPGHTTTSVAYYVEPFEDNPGLVFTGDTLFVNGCGRILGGNGQTMWHSLEKLAALPEDTEVYCGHDYAEENYRFALEFDPENDQIRQRLKEVRLLNKEKKPTVPTTIGLEKSLNPFLRAENLTIRKAVHMEQAKAWEVFAELRNRKDSF